jgi:hypothetical protein
VVQDAGVSDRQMQQCRRAFLPAVLVAAAGLAMTAQGLLRRRGWARWAAVVACSLLGVTALAGLLDWIKQWLSEWGRRRSTWSLRCCSWPAASESSSCS